MSHGLSSLLGSIHGGRLRHSSYLSVPNKYLYVDTPKAACTTLKHLVAQIERVPENNFRQSPALDSKIEQLVHDRAIFSLPSLSDVPPATAEEALTSHEFFRFCFVRNPHSRIFSAWQSKLLLREPYFMASMKPDLLSKFSKAKTWQDIRQSFKEFVKQVSTAEYPDFTDAHWQPQHRLISFGAIDYTMIGRTESFAEDIQKLFAHLQQKGVQKSQLTLRRSNSGLFRDWRWFYDQETADIVHEMYRDDFRLFGYSDKVELPSSGQTLPADATDPRMGDWIDEIVSRNEMIYLLRSRLVDQISETEQLREQIHALREKMPSELISTDSAKVASALPLDAQQSGMDTRAAAKRDGVLSRLIVRLKRELS